jgi:hypothetical protein
MGSCLCTILRRRREDNLGEEYECMFHPSAPPARLVKSWNDGGMRDDDRSGLRVSDQPLDAMWGETLPGYEAATSEGVPQLATGSVKSVRKDSDTGMGIWRRVDGSESKRFNRAPHRTGELQGSKGETKTTSTRDSGVYREDDWDERPRDDQGGLSVLQNNRQRWDLLHLDPRTDHRRSGTSENTERSGRDFTATALDPSASGTALSARQRSNLCKYVEVIDTCCWEMGGDSERVKLRARNSLFLDDICCV